MLLDEMRPKQHIIIYSNMSYDQTISQKCLLQALDDNENMPTITTKSVRMNLVLRRLQPWRLPGSVAHAFCPFNPFHSELFLEC